MKAPWYWERQPLQSTLKTDFNSEKDTSQIAQDQVLDAH